MLDVVGAILAGKDSLVAYIHSKSCQDFKQQCIMLIHRSCIASCSYINPTLLICTLQLVDLCYELKTLNNYHLPR